MNNEPNVQHLVWRNDAETLEQVTRFCRENEERIRELDEGQRKAMLRICYPQKA